MCGIVLGSVGIACMKNTLAGVEQCSHAYGVAMTAWGWSMAGAGCCFGGCLMDIEEDGKTQKYPAAYFY